jgi:hypothetical protein
MCVGALFTRLYEYKREVAHPLGDGGFVPNIAAFSGWGLSISTLRWVLGGSAVRGAPVLSLWMVRIMRIAQIATAPVIIEPTRVFI